MSVTSQQLFCNSLTVKFVLFLSYAPLSSVVHSSEQESEMDITVHVTITLDSSRQLQSFRDNACSLSIEIGGSSLENCQKLLKIYQQYLQNSYSIFKSELYSSYSAYILCPSIEIWRKLRIRTFPKQRVNQNLILSSFDLKILGIISLVW